MLHFFTGQKQTNSEPVNQIFCSQKGYANKSSLEHKDFCSLMVQIPRGVRKANSLLYLKSSRVMSSQASSCKTQSCHKDKLMLLSPTSLHPDISDIQHHPRDYKTE